MLNVGTFGIKCSFKWDLKIIYENSIFDNFDGYYTRSISYHFLASAWKQPVMPKPVAQETTQPANETQVAASTVNQATSVQPSVSTPALNPKPESDEEKTERVVREANQPYDSK